MFERFTTEAPLEQQTPQHRRLHAARAHALTHDSVSAAIAAATTWTPTR
jgi:hypothetical protein